MDEKKPQNSLTLVKIHDSSGQKIVVVLVRGHLHYTIIILHYFVSLSLKKQSWALDNTITRLCFQVSKLLVITLLLYLSWLLYLDSDPLLRCRCREATKLSGAQLFKKHLKCSSSSVVSTGANASSAKQSERSHTEKTRYPKRFFSWFLPTPTYSKSDLKQKKNTLQNDKLGEKRVKDVIYTGKKRFRYIYIIQSS